MRSICIKHTFCFDPDWMCEFSPTSSSCPFDVQPAATKMSRIHPKFSWIQRRVWISRWTLYTSHTSTA